MIIMLENAMHEHVISITTKPNPLIEGLKLGRSRKRRGKKDFSEEQGFGS